ncbi:hypothetical protein K1719_016809 [Acacia pycnantha]|nr:hypothetical protein K1719_016809 [Acacia pycnantha]
MKISNFNSIEKVVVEEKEGSEDEIAFSSLEILELECLPKIKWFCSCNCFLNLPLLKKVVVNKCPRMESFSGKDTSTPKLQKISSKDGKVYWEGDINKTIKKLFADMVMFSGFVDECPNLKYVFSSSLCHDLRQLEVLDVRSCGVEQIVANEEGLEELKFHFPPLRILWLINLRQLNDFYQKRYTLECPSLKKLNVSQCESLQIFAFEHLDSYQLNGGCGDLPIQQALFHIEKVPENLEEISLTERDTMRILNGNYERKLFQRT